MDFQIKTLGSKSVNRSKGQGVIIYKASLQEIWPLSLLSLKVDDTYPENWRCIGDRFSTVLT